MLEHKMDLVQKNFIEYVIAEERQYRFYNQNKIKYLVDMLINHGII